MRFFTFCIFLSVIAITLNAQERQLPLSRVTLMPDMPTPYVMRDWKKVTKEYDALIFNTTTTGTHWPLVKIKAEGINFPSISPILMDTYVGN
jgi:hypothetical protein